ncbi:MAG: S53 family peptidase, partial [Mycobacteriales bacterium]
TPQDLWSIYDQPATDEGQGQTIGIFGEGETDSVVTQLRLFEQHEKLPKIPVRVVHTEGGTDDDYADNTGSIEWYLDVQASTGMAPKAGRLDLYFAKSLFDADIAADISGWVNDPNGPKEMNASFGECETSPANPVTGPLAQIPYGTELGDELEPVAEPMLEKAAAMGRTLFASAGDTGSGCPEVVVPVAGAGNGVAPQPLPIPNYPCASAYAVCVGGTVLETDGTDHGKRVSEDAWMDTGGGPSHFILEPKYQQKTAYITATNAPCLTDAAGTPHPAGSVCRGTPDVAALSGNILGNGYFIYIDGEPSSEGGTSLSSPLMMGMWARLQAAAPTSAGLGFANETFYGQADKGAATYARDFTDITATDTEQTAGVSTTNGFYPAAAGYDFVSGLGALDVRHLLTDVDGTTAARHAQSAPARPQVVRSTVSMHSPTGNASDPLVVSTGNLPAIDLSGASLTTSPDGSTVTATLTGPALSATPDALAGTGGEDFYVYWYDAAKDTVYYVHAHTDAAAGTTYSAGSTTGGSYTDVAAAGATGSFTGTTLKITAKLAALGAPRKGDRLGDPAAITQLGAGVPAVLTLLSLTADSASYPSVGAANAGDAVCVGGCG